MSRPTVLPDWATATNYTAGTYVGQSTKSTPPAGNVAEGFNAGYGFPIEWLNFMLNNHAAWIAYLDGTGGNDVYGDGSDGAAVLDGVGAVTGCSGTGPYTATRDLSFSSAVFSAGVTLKMAGFRIYINGLLDMSSAAPVLQCNGNVGGTGAGGGAGGVRPGASGALGAAAGGAGGAGGVNGGSDVVLAVAFGGIGGVGGVGGGAGAPGTSGATTVAASLGNIHVPPSLISGVLLGAAGASPVQGGVGGGGGQGSAVLIGGGGGSGGGVLFASARSVNFSGTAIVSVIGGAGGAGAVGAGGGGGGGGGYIRFLYRDTLGTAPATVIGASSYAGGAAGAGGGGGGAAGAAGSAGAALVRTI